MRLGYERGDASRVESVLARDHQFSRSGGSSTVTGRAAEKKMDG